MTIRAEESYIALSAARARQKTEEFKQQYAKRSGVEGTISQAVRAFGIRRSRYVGFAKTHLQHVLTGAALNLARVSDWLSEATRSTTRKSPFQRLVGIVPAMG